MNLHMECIKSESCSDEVKNWPHLNLAAEFNLSSHAFIYLFLRRVAPTFSPPDASPGGRQRAHCVGIAHTDSDTHYAESS